MTEEKKSEEAQDASEPKADNGQPTPMYAYAFVALVTLVAVTVFLSRAGFVTMKP